jgi:hypothetical protein
MRHLYFLFFLVLILNINLSYAHEHHTQSKTSSDNIKIFLENPPSKIIANQTVTIRLQLLKDNKFLTSNDFKEVHTAKIHLMVIDSSLTDYYHIHPVVDEQNHDFIFNFTPKKNGAYRMWVDITPVATDKQEFLMTDVGTGFKKSVINKEVALNSATGPYHFTLTLDGEPKVEQPIMATITVTKAGNPFNQLEPVMGAFAHVVGFSDDNSSILHIHPMGKNPHKISEHGGPTLTFHIEPKKTGFVKLFAQFRIDGKDIYVPFGIMVK